MEVVSRLNIRFGAMDGPVHLVIGLEQSRKMTIRFLQMTHQRNVFGNSTASSCGVFDMIPSPLSG